MDFNRNHQNQQDSNNHWDRWNSNASNSSYYNQPTHRPYGQGFMIASGICGLLSLTACCTGILSLPLGALGILFAALTYRKGKKINSACLIGVVSSCLGIVSAVILMINAFTMLPELMKNESFRGQLDAVTQQMYGMDFITFMEEYYGYSIE